MTKRGRGRHAVVMERTAELDNAVGAQPERAGDPDSGGGGGRDPAAAREPSPAVESCGRGGVGTRPTVGGLDRSHQPAGRGGALRLCQLETLVNRPCAGLQVQVTAEDEATLSLAVDLVSLRIV